MLITMSDKEIQRLAVLQDVRDHRITQVRAAEILSLSTRQITRLLQKLNQDGVSGMVHASRGQPGHHRHDDLLKSKCLSIISEYLLGFGPTLAHEKLSSMFALDMALLQITTNGKLKTVLAKGAAYESFPWSAFSGRNHSLGCALVL